MIVCFGYQWKSQFYSTPDLETNVEKMFQAALDSVNARNSTTAQLLFRKLEGGYGGHLFNEIARHTIGSDIAVFDFTSPHFPLHIAHGRLAGAHERSLFIMQLLQSSLVLF